MKTFSTSATTLNRSGFHYGHRIFLQSFSRRKIRNLPFPMLKWKAEVSSLKVLMQGMHSIDIDAKKTIALTLTCTF